jgi:aldehyde dehydrogenase (NAD+)
LELGGKCPVVVDTTADIDFAANKICFARFNNSGQTCIATDYVIVHESVLQRFLDRLKYHLKAMFGDGGDQGSPDMGKIIIEWHCDRIEDLLKGHGGQVVCGGKVNKGIKYIEPTVVLNPKPDSKLMKEEIFGPILPIVTFVNFSEVIELINSKDKPLAVYYFGSVLLGKNDNLERL